MDRFEEGDEVLGYGASGGVGHVGVQLAERFGAGVSATASSAEKRSFAADLGADATVDYTATDVAALVDDRAVEPHVDERFAFDEVADAHRPGESGDFRGTILLVNE